MHRTKPCILYILKCCDGSLYTGVTTDLHARLDEHRRGVGSAYTIRRRPVHLVYYERHPSKQAAELREREVKGWSRRKKWGLISQGSR